MTWVDDQHVGCSVGDAADHGWCKKTSKLTCRWCGHAECEPPRCERHEVHCPKCPWVGKWENYDAHLDVCETENA